MAQGSRFSRDIRSQQTQEGRFSDDIRSQQSQDSGILGNATLFEAMINKRKGIIIASETEIAEFRRKIGKQTEERMLDEIRLQVQTEEEAQKKLAERLVDIMQKAQAIKFKNATTYDKIQMLESSKRHRQLALEDTNDMLAYYKAKGRLTEEEAAENARLQRQKRKIERDERKAAEELHTLKMQQMEQESESNRKLLAATQKEIEATSGVIGRKLAQAAKQARQEANNLRADADLASEKLADAKKRYNEAAQKGDTRAADALLEEIKHLSQESEKANELAKKAEDNAVVREKNQEAWANYGRDLLKKGIETISKTLSKALSAVDKDIDYVVSLRSPLMARLQGAEHSFSDMLDLVTKNLAVSPFVTQKAVLDKIKEAAEDGIAYNVEQRAFIASISDKLVSTFDAFDASIERMIRLQQADSTVARLGMEATLTRWLNGYFSDSSYLSSLFDSVSATILEATSLLSRDEALAMEYQTQKWLSALYSLGLSEQTVNMIAQGIAYLGTGNVQSLAGNTQMQTLFAMAAARSGLSYANILLGGLNAEDTNTLLKAMVEYLRDIAANSANQVVKSSYGSILNLSLADMKAISNLTDADISSISSLTQSYSEAVGEAGRQMWDLPNRMSVGEMISTALANLSFTTAEGIANNPVSLALWQIVGMIQDATGGIPLPAVSVMGNMVDLSAFQVEQLLQLGMVGIGFLSNVGSVANSLGASTGMFGNLQAYWSGKEYLGRGQGNFITPTGASMGTSASGTVATSSSKDVANAAISEQTEESEETAEITNRNVKPEHTFDEFYEAIFNEPLPITVRAGKDPVDGYFDWAHIAKSLDAFILDTYVPFTEALNANLFDNESTGFVKIITTTGEGFTHTGTALGTIDDSVVSLRTQTKDLFGDKSLVDNERLKVKDDGIDFSIFSVGGVAIGLLVKNIGDYIGSTNSSGLRGTSSDILKYMGTFQSPTTGASVLGRLHGIYGYAESIKKSIQGDGTGNIFKRLDDIMSYIGSTNSSGLRKQLGTIADRVSALGSSVSSSSSSSGVSTIAGYIGADASGNTTVRGLLKQIRDKDVSATINAQSISLSGSMTVSGITDAVLDRIVKKLTKMYTGVEAPTTGTVNRDAAEMVRREFFNGGFNAGKEDVGDSLQAIIYQLLYGVTKVQETDGTRKNPFVQQGTGNYVY